MSKVAVRQLILERRSEIENSGRKLGIRNLLSIPSVLANFQKGLVNFKKSFGLSIEIAYIASNINLICTLTVLVTNRKRDNECYPLYTATPKNV